MFENTNKQLMLSKEIDNILRKKTLENEIYKINKNTDFNPDNESCAFNSARDVTYSKTDCGSLDNTLMIFTQQWVGIRQSCGALPGHKLAIDGNHKWNMAEILTASEFIASNKIQCIFSHGMAPNNAVFLRAIKRLMPDIKIYGVWHGTMAGWSSKEEVELFKNFIGLADDDVFEKVAFLRSGMHHLSKKSFKKTLFNMPPTVKIDRIKSVFSTKPINCIFPSWNNHWKNMYTNILGANTSINVKNVYSYSGCDYKSIDKFKHVEFGNYNLHLQRLSLMDLCLNVSINDCQPMTELEGLSVNTPSIRNNLDFDIGSNHEYENLFIVNQYLNADAISLKIDEICIQDPAYIEEIVNDYKNHITNISIQRYNDFIS